MPHSLDGNELVDSGEFTPTAVTFPNGTHICEVEIDPDTGEPKCCATARWRSSAAC